MRNWTDGDWSNQTSDHVPAVSRALRARPAGYLTSDSAI